MGAVAAVQVDRRHSAQELQKELERAHGSAEAASNTPCNTGAFKTIRNKRFQQVTAHAAAYHSDASTQALCVSLRSTVDMAPCSTVTRHRWSGALRSTGGRLPLQRRRNSCPVGETRRSLSGERNNIICRHGRRADARHRCPRDRLSRWVQCCRRL